MLLLVYISEIKVLIVIITGAKVRTNFDLGYYDFGYDYDYDFCYGFDYGFGHSYRFDFGY